MKQRRRERSIGDYRIEGKLGSGSFAEVYRACHMRTGREVAVKAIALSKMNKKLEKNLESEIAILRKIEHPNVVSLIGLHKSDRHMYLIMEMCAGGDLHKYIRKHSPLPETTIRAFMRQLSSGLRVLWSSNLVHRDLKPQNLLLSVDGPTATLKIADFGFAIHLAVSSMAETMCGSPLYMAPEILRLRKYDAKADLWSVGTILFEMLCGRPPFTGANQIELLKNIETKEYRIPDDMKITEDADRLLKGLLQRNPLLRISFEEFFSHNYLARSSSDTIHENKEQEEKKMENDEIVLPKTATMKRIVKKKVSKHYHRLDVSSEYVIVPGTIRKQNSISTEQAIVRRVREIVVCRHFTSSPSSSISSMMTSDCKDDQSMCTTTYNNVKRQLVIEFGNEIVEKHKTKIQAVLQSCAGGVLSSLEIRRQTAMAVFDLAIDTKRDDPAGATLLCLRALHILHHTFVSLNKYVNTCDVETTRNLIRMNFQDIINEARICRKIARISSGSIERTDCVEAHLWYVFLCCCCCCFKNHSLINRYGALAKCRASAGQELMGAKVGSARNCKSAIFLLGALEDLIRARDDDAVSFEFDFRYIEELKSMLRQSLIRVSGMMVVSPSQ
jgi:serine/threonine protein kinase